MSATITFTPVSHDEMTCEVRSPMGRRLTLSGTLSTIEPHLEGDSAMLANAALVHNSWAFTKHEKQHRISEEDEKKTSHRKQAKTHAETAKNIATLVDLLGSTSREGWCSGCYTLSEHRKVLVSRTSVPAYLCETCGSPTLKCIAPQCKNMATRGIGSVRIPRYCAEHRHEIPSFSRAGDKIDALEDYAKLRIFDRRNLTQGPPIAAVGLVTAGIIGTVGLIAAPAVGSALGTLLRGYTGAAASSYGLALLGCGPIASGGLGMVGGTYVVTAAAATLGTARGASIMNSYIGEDKSFHIEKLRDGSGTPVIIARGFMTEVDKNWRSAVQTVEQRYPESPIYLLHWGSTEPTNLAALAVKNLGAKHAVGIVADAAAKAGKVNAKKLGVVMPTLLIADLAKNPWHTAMVRADRTGVDLAGILARTNIDKCILVGHDLGARAMITAAETLAKSGDAPRIDTMHLLGAAQRKKGDWRLLNDSVINAVHNYYSNNDDVLKYAFTTANFGSVAVGLRGFTTKFDKIEDHDVSSAVNGHSEYFKKVCLV